VASLDRAATTLKPVAALKPATALKALVRCRNLQALRTT